MGGVPIILLAIAFLLASAGVGFIMVLQSMMIADCVDYEGHKNGTRPDGVFFSGQSFLTKLAAGIAVMIQGLCYMIVGYETDAITSMNSALNSGLVTFAEEYRTFAMIMFFLVSIPPAIGMVLSIIPMLKYELTDKEHTRILDELNAKRLGNGDDSAMTLETEVTAEGAENTEVVENAANDTQAVEVEPVVMPVDTQEALEAKTEEVVEETPVVEEEAEVKAEETAEEVVTEDKTDVVEEKTEETAE